MIPAFIRYPMLLAALAAAWQPSKAFASDEETQFWLNTIVTGGLSEDTTLTIDGTQRWRKEEEGSDQRTIRVLVEQQVGDAARVGGGIGVFETGGLTEIRLAQQAVFTPGRFELRTRLEERFFDSADRMELRLRQRVQYNQPIAQGWRGTAGVEWLGIMQSRNSDEGASTDQWRFQTSIVHSLGENLDIGAIYWLVIFPRAGLPSRTNHIPQAVVTYRF
ncbi:DUF2490 domain-containing protein [Erythrobacter sanguineus]|uniref:DUF2490 domain-containing protein n=2 Tax=Erythrobacter sanguineus TaxID=198312 RepID=A0A1M7S2H7_9SPHN|nr:DUF2490 domain-containing protein [Erythrobacter sanguineus]SHN52701.1 Protein of unknown function [Erythrobacter sanguineus]